jgi:diguanylate cyclase (GGDEF)-like protein
MPEKILNRPYAPQQEEITEGNSWASMQNAVKREGRWSGEFVIRSKSNELLPLWATLHAVVDPEGRPTNYVLTLSDLTSLKSSQEELLRLLSKDTLTGLSNRREFFEQIEKTIERAARQQQKFGLLAIDLQRFKELNDSIGHQAGDKVLQKVASRLTGLRTEDEAIGRLGADEFGFVIPDCSNDLDVAMAIENIRKAVEAPMTIGEHSISLSVCIGVASYPDDGEDVATLAKNVDLALASAATKGTALTRFFTQRMFKNVSKQFWLENNLRNSFGTSQLIPFFQPQLNLHNNRPEEAEVLIRWIHPESGMISPGEFIPVAEKTGLIGKVTSEVIASSCRHMAEWKVAGMPLSCLAINISAGLLLAPDFVSSLCQIIEQYKLAPEDILVEITESSAMDDPEQTSAVLKQLKDYGLTLAIDDFGTGYSSLSYLRKFDVDQVKIDQSFVKDLASSQESRTIVKAIIRMCETLGFETLAEGIETHEQMQILHEFGCQKLQGYLIARPLNAVDFQTFMHTHGQGMKLPSK